MGLLSPRPKALVFEPSAQGHRLNYARTVIEAVHPLADQVIFCTQESTAASREYAVHFTQLPANATVEVFRSSGNRSVFRSQVYFARMYLAAIKRLQPDYVYVPTADGLIQWIGWLRILTGNRSETPAAEMLVMRGHNYLGVSSSWKQRLKRRWAVAGIRSSGCARLHALDDQLYALLSECELGDIQLSLMPETRNSHEFPGKQVARKEFCLEPEDLVVGFFGRRDTRKGFDLLLRAFAKLDHPRAKLLVLGQDDKSTADLYSSIASGGLLDRIATRNAYVSTQELHAGMAAADVICIPYPTHDGSSGFLVDAAATGNFILASDYGWIGRSVRDYELGATCNVRDSNAFIDALSEAIQSAESFKPGQRSDCFLKANSPENVKLAWAHGITVYRTSGEPGKTIK